MHESEAIEQLRNNSGDDFMEFNLKAIQEAQEKYTGPEFPKLIREFKRIGILKNTYELNRGVITYENKEGMRIECQAEAIQSEVPIKYCHKTALVALKRNQTGESDFIDFCREIAQAGVYKWVSDLEQMTCSYYDTNEIIVIVEAIPNIE